MRKERTFILNNWKKLVLISMKLMHFYQSFMQMILPKMNGCSKYLLKIKKLKYL